MPAADDFSSYKAGLAGPYEHCALVTPHDENELAKVTRGISFKTAGALAVVTKGGEEVVIASGALAAGVIHKLRVKQVKSTGTTAGDIVAYW